MRVFAWDIPRSDSLYVGAMPDSNSVVITMWTKIGSPVFVMVSKNDYEAIQGYFSDPGFLEQSKKHITGYEFVVTYVQKFSLLTRRQMNALSPKKKMAAKAFNEIEKYALTAESPRKVKGIRDSDGNIIPDFSDFGSNTASSPPPTVITKPAVTTTPPATVINTKNTVRNTRTAPVSTLEGVKTVN